MTALGSGPDAGFSLVEVVVAATILTIAAAGLMRISTLSTSGNTRSKDEAAAVALATERIEDLKHRGYNSLPPSTGPFFDGDFTADGGASGIYSRTYQVSPEQIVTGVPGRVVDVWVSWTGGGYVALSTMMVNPQQGGAPAAFVRSWNHVR